MSKYLAPPDQKIKNAKRKEVPHSKEKTKRVELHPVGFPTNQGDLGVRRVDNPGIARMVQAPTRSGDGIRSHVGKVGSVMKKAGMMV